MLFDISILLPLFMFVYIKKSLCNNNKMEKNYIPMQCIDLFNAVGYMW